MTLAIMGKLGSYVIQACLPCVTHGMVQDFVLLGPGGPAGLAVTRPVHGYMSPGHHTLGLERAR
jgi:hypothetical protein